MKRIVVVLVFLFSISCFSQFSKTHYIPPLSNANTQAPQGQFLYVSCPSTEPVKFKIIALGGGIVNATVSRDSPYSFSIGNGFDTQLMVSAANVSNVLNNKGYIIEAEDLVYVTVRLSTTVENFQAGGLVSKGIAALGTAFRVGAFTNAETAVTSENHYTFAAILATENNTLVSFDDIDLGVSLINNTAAGSSPLPILLNRGESFVIAVQGPNNANRDGLIGMLITADKPIAVNCGSIAGTNGNTSNLDLGFDQIVGADKIGQDYIFIKGIGPDIVERPLIVAHEDNTQIFLNGDFATPFATLDFAGDYVAINGSQYGANGNLYVSASKNVFAYQGIGGSAETAEMPQANQNMSFVPPLSCRTPKIIDNIPFINQIGDNPGYIATVAVVTETGAELNFLIDEVAYTIDNLPQAITAIGPSPVTGNDNYVTYVFQGLTGNVSLYSTKQVYLSYFGSSGFATYGGFYSGFTFKPEIAFNPISTAITLGCIPNINLSVSTLTAFDTFQWYFNDVLIQGATDRNYIPMEVPDGLGPGFYKVIASISQCSLALPSDSIPVSSCAVDSDSDTIIDNIDTDIDNDGLTNCFESYGNLPIDLSVSSTQTIAVGNYSNSFNNTATSSTFIGNPDGSFVSKASVGINNSVTKTLNFTSPISLNLAYVATALDSDLLSSEGNFVLQVPADKTITVQNPDDQLLIDTNYDGVYESGITEFSSFEIRFRLNSAIALAAGSGTFQFKTNLVTSFTYIHENLSDIGDNRATFLLTTNCIPKDTDNDSIPDQLDFDSDNDGIPDEVEALGANFIPVVFVDDNSNGQNDVYEGIVALDTDSDDVADCIDLDSDNDGLYDLLESQSNAVDADGNGILDGTIANFGQNGFLNTLETALDSGILNYTIAETDGVDGIPNYIDLDTDNDGCLDVTEASFNDANFDGQLGDAPLDVDDNGVVISSPNGYTVPSNNNYLINGSIIINTQPQNQNVCHANVATFFIDTITADTYQWQVSTNTIDYNNLSDNAQYSGTNTNTLVIANIDPTMSGYRYKVILNRVGNSCGLLSSNATLTVLARPNVPANITLKQCDDDLDLLTNFNLTQINNLISTNTVNETFRYFSTSTAAETADTAFEITSPTVYNNNDGNTLFVRVQNADLCFNVTQLNLTVSATQIPAGTSWSFARCDDYIDANNDDRDGISVFDFSSVTADINNNILSNNSNYSIAYFKNEADALAETDAQGNSLAITNISNYRNIGYPSQQFIWVRIDSTNDNACFGLGPFINLTVEALPIANLVNIPRACDRITNDADTDYFFDTSLIEATVLNGQSNVDVTYFDANDNALPSPLPNPFLTTSQTIRIRVTNKITADPNGPCFDETMLNFIVDSQAVANPIVVLPICDDLPLDDDGFSNFDTSTIESTLIGNQTGFGFTVAYFAEDGSVLPSPLDNPFNTKTQNVLAVVKNPLNPNCFDQTTISFVVNSLPDIEVINPDEIAICFGVPNANATLNAGLQSGVASDYTFEWSRNGAVIPSGVLYNLTVDEDGVYTVKVTNKLTGCFRIRTNTVVYSQIPTIDTIVIKDLVDNNSVTIFPLGLGTYEYSLDNPEGPFQDNPFFDNVSPGFHEVFITDTKGCGNVSQLISVVGAPLFFTPNGDSFNDTWKIKGVNPVFYKNSSVLIYDRFGKLMTEIPTGSDIGWDGTYNGNPMPADDYWYVLYLDDGRIARGHFALKR